MAPKLFKVVYSSSKYCDLKTLQVLHHVKNHFQEKEMDSEWTTCLEQM